MLNWDGVASLVLEKIAMGRREIGSREGSGWRGYRKERRERRGRDGEEAETSSDELSF